MIATVWDPASQPHSAATAGSASGLPDDQNDASPAAVAPSSRFSTPAAVASRFSSSRNVDSPGALPMTNMSGARRYFTRYLSNLPGLSKVAGSSASAMVLPR